MKIAIDARMWNETGVGRYIRHLVQGMVKLDKKNEYYLIFREPEYSNVNFTEANVEKVKLDVRWHTISEQFLLPLKLLFIKPDLLHVPHFNMPILYPWDFIATMHDLTTLKFKSGRVTLKSWPAYKLWRLGFEVVAKIGVKRAKKVLTISHSSKNDIVKTLGVSQDKVVVTHLGGFDEQKNQTPYKEVYDLRKDEYLLYVGTAYQHKNLGFMVKALSRTDKKFVVVGKIDDFKKQLKNEFESAGLGDKVIFTGFVEDDVLANLYSGAYAFVFPTLSEGFGIPGLEAMARGCPVVCSDIPVLREVYDGAALFFDPTGVEDFIDKLSLLEDKKIKEGLITKGLKQITNFSWDKTVEETLKVYKGIFAND